MAGLSSWKRNSSGTAVCMRKASSEDLMRALTAASPGYFIASNRFNSWTNSKRFFCSSVDGAISGDANGSGFSGSPPGARRCAAAPGNPICYACSVQVRRHGRSQHNKLGNVVVQAAQPVMHPRTDGRVKGFEDVATGVKEEVARRDQLS